MTFTRLLNGSVVELFGFYLNGHHKPHYKTSLWLTLLGIPLGVILTLVFGALYSFVLHGTIDFERLFIEDFYAYRVVVFSLVSAGNLVVMLYGRYLFFYDRSTPSSISGLFRQLPASFALKVFCAFLAFTGIGVAATLIGDLPYDGFYNTMGNFIPSYRTAISELALSYLSVAVAAWLVSKSFFQQVHHWKPVLVAVVLSFLFITIYAEIITLFDAIVVNFIESIMTGNMFFGPLMKLGFIIVVNAYGLAGLALCYTIPFKVLQNAKHGA